MKSNVDNEVPAVSVIMAAYNVQNIIEKSVNSVLGQTFANFELLICDDKSTDNTYQVILKLSQKDSRIRPFQNEKNIGQASTRNFLFSKARSEFIMIMDSDDQIMPEKIEKQMRFLSQNADVDYVATWATIVDDGFVPIQEATGLQGRVSPKDYLFGMPFLHASTMFRRKAIVAAGGYSVEPDTRFRNEDYDMLMRICAMGFNGYVIPEKLYIYLVGTAAVKRRRFKYRMAEARVRYRNFKNMGLMPKGYLYVIKPLIVGLFPHRVLEVARRFCGKK